MRFLCCAHEFSHRLAPTIKVGMRGVIPRCLLALLCCCALFGCTNKRAAPARSLASTQSSTEKYEPELNATVSPPAGWRLDIKSPLQKEVRHYVWVSPTGNTAFGVMRFSLPFPLPHEPVLWAFMGEMRRSEGEARLLNKVWDKTLPGLRFEAEGGRYKMRTNLTVRGLSGWMSYVGTLRERAVDEAELKTAVEARERTKFGH